MKKLLVFILTLALVLPCALRAEESSTSDSDSTSPESTDTSAASEFGDDDEDTAAAVEEIVGTASFTAAYGDSGSAKYYGSKIAALEAQKAKYVENKMAEANPGLIDIIDAKIAAVKKQAASERATGKTSTTSSSTSDNGN